MAFLSSDIIEQIKERVTLSSFMDKKLSLQQLKKNPSDNTYKACCPFHNDKTPSLSINDDLGIFNCFGCGESGDAIDVLVQHGGLSFSKALEELCLESGLDYKQLVSDSKAIGNLPSLPKDYSIKIREFNQHLFTEFSGYTHRGKGLEECVLIPFPTKQQAIYNLAETSQMFNYPSINAVLNSFRSNAVLMDGAAASGVIDGNKFLLNTKKFHIPLFRVDTPLKGPNPLPYCITSSQIKQIQCAGFYVLDDNMEPHSVYPKSAINDHSSLLMPVLNQLDFIKKFDSIYIVESPDEYFKLQKMGVNNVIAPATTNQLNISHLRQIASLPISKVIWITTRQQLATEHNISRLNMFSEGLGANKSLNFVILSPGSSFSSILEQHGEEGFTLVSKNSKTHLDVFLMCLSSYKQMSENSANVAKHAVNGFIKKLIEAGKSVEAYKVALVFGNVRQMDPLSILCSALKVDHRQLVQKAINFQSLENVDYSRIEYAQSNEDKLALAFALSQLTSDPINVSKLVFKGNNNLHQMFKTIYPVLGKTIEPDLKPNFVPN